MNYDSLIKYVFCEKLFTIIVGFVFFLILPYYLGTYCWLVIKREFVKISKHLAADTIISNFELYLVNPCDKYKV